MYEIKRTIIKRGDEILNWRDSDIPTMFLGCPGCQWKAEVAHDINNQHSIIYCPFSNTCKKAMSFPRALERMSYEEAIKNGMDLIDNAQELVIEGGKIING